jgi:hypothetical protein
MDTNQFQAAMAGYVEQVRAAAFHEGRIAGRKEARDELRFFFDKFEEAFPIEPVEPRQGKRASKKTDDEPTVWLTPEEVNPLVKEALLALAAHNPDGASPMQIAEQLKPGGKPINAQAVRQSLRQLCMSGEARRMAHARYLPAQPPATLALSEPQPEAAE